MIVERSAESINILQQKIENYFLQNKRLGTENNLWFPDSSQNQKVSLAKDKVTDVILFGSFFRRILESGNWPFDKMRLWCLSPSVKRVLTKLYGFKEQEIGLISRDDLFTQASLIRPFPDLNKPWTMVFSGRLSPTKNLETFLVVGHFLQKLFSPELRLALQGDFHDDVDSMWDREGQVSYKNYLEKIIDSLSWTHRPIFLSPSHDYPWQKDHTVNPVFASFSHFSAEDFGVSVALAREEAWPVILSDWGGQSDVYGESVIKISAHSIPEPWESLHSLLVKGEYLAKLIIRRWGEKSEKIIFPQNLPVILDANNLYDRRQHFVKKLDLNFADLFCGDGKLDNFFKKENGKRIFSNYRQLFSAPLNSDKYLLIVTHDMEPDAGGIAALVPDITRLWFHYAHKENLSVQFIFIRDLMKRLQFFRQANLEALVFPFFVNSLVPLVQFLTKGFALSCPLYVFNSEDQDRIHEDLVAQIFRNEDAYIVTNKKELSTFPLGKNPSTYLQAVKKVEHSDLFSIVEVEINNECNNKCSYCPNSISQRKSSKYLEISLYRKLLTELSALSFSGIFSFHFYNEPLLHPHLIEWVELASKALPSARFHLYTNATLLTLEKFRQLTTAGIHLIKATRHEEVRSLPLDIWYSQLSPLERSQIELEDASEINKTNRGGILSLGTSITSNLPCYIPSSMIVVTSDGNILSCYEDFAEKLILGNLKTQTLVEIWKSDRAKSFREKLTTGKRLDFDLCSRCNNSRIFPIR